MAVKQLPTIQEFYSGENITPTQRSISFNMGEKLETIVKISQDNPYTLDISHIDNIKTLSLFGSGEFFLDLITMVLVEEGDGEEIEDRYDPEIFSIAIDKTFRLDSHSNFFDSFDEILLSTVEEGEVTIDVRAYGEVRE